jgi:Tfp pilus assembly protein PilO
MTGRMAIYTAVSALVILLCVAFVLLPAQQRNSELKQQISALRQQLEDYETTMSAIPRFVAARQQLAGRRRHLIDRLYGKEEVLALISHLERRAGDHRLTLVEVTPPVPELLKISRAHADRNEPLFLNLVLRLEGDYIDFGRFVRRVESDEYFRGVNRCRISSDDSRDGRLALLLGFRALLGGTREES